MEITTTKIEQTLIQYTVIDGEWTYMDTLVFSPKELEALTEADIQKMINDKYSVWKVYVTMPAKIPTKAENEARIVQLQKEKADIDKEIIKLSSKIK